VRVCGVVGRLGGVVVCVVLWCVCVCVCRGGVVCVRVCKLCGVVYVMCACVCERESVCIYMCV